MPSGTVFYTWVNIRCKNLPRVGQDSVQINTKLEQQLEAARRAELDGAVQQVRQIVQEYGLTVDDLGLAIKAKKRKGTTVAPKYMDPKTGATWSGRGRAPAWIGKNRDRFLIK
nr:H-NS histone family protein [Ralstonia pickettii]